MALWDTMMVEDHLKSSGKYCIRTKRLSGHHINNNKYLQFQRRSSEATLTDFDHHRSHHHHWVFTSPSSTHYAARGAGHHGIKALGRASGSGSGSSPLPSSSSVPVKMPTGRSDEVDDDMSDDEDASQAHMFQPSSYTFRRRNAIVEGSEDAPKPSEFSDSASGSE
ncbi:hypothetical protein BGZ52_005726 [Haplosporangium bisporale]|nr:hypothetical protein BGZ52_005726 [Haplosporangium bisporale]